MKLLKHKDQLYTQAQYGPWEGLVKAEFTEAEKIRHNWTGPRRTLEQWRQVCAFFEWSQKEHLSEALVQWLVDLDSGLWQPLAPPQKGVGMTVKVLEDHPSYRSSYERLGPGNWKLMGTDHHHCVGSAFASGTDQHDEITKEGLHMTVGGVSTSLYSLDARVVFRGVVTGVSLGEWYEVPEEYQSLPVHIRTSILAWLMVQPPESCVPGEDFPLWWAENYHKQTHVQTYQPGQYNYLGGQQNWQPASEISTNVHGRTRWGQEREIQRDLEKLAADGQVTVEETVEWLETLQHTMTEDLLDLCLANYCDLVEVIDAGKNLLPKQIGFGRWQD